MEKLRVYFSTGSQEVAIGWIVRDDQGIHLQLEETLLVDTQFSRSQIERFIEKLIEHPIKMQKLRRGIAGMRTNLTPGSIEHFSQISREYGPFQVRVA